MTVINKNTPVFVTCHDVIPAVEELAENKLKSILMEHFLFSFLTEEA